MENKYVKSCKVNFNSISGEDIPDEVYFFQRPGYISNSSLGLINPFQDFGKDYGCGSPQLYKNRPKFQSSSLILGSAIHEVLLQPDDFILSDYEGKPGGKLGSFIEKVYQLRKDNNYTFYKAFDIASKEIGYYENKLSKGIIRKIIREGLDYYLRLCNHEFEHETKEVIVLPKNLLDNAKRCIKAYNDNFVIHNILKENLFEPKKLLNEIALYSEIQVTLPEGTIVPLKIKGKLDSVVIDPEQKIIYLNDLKTTSKPYDFFMGKTIDGVWYNGSFEHHCYYRQMFIYALMLQKYCYEVLNLTDYTMRCNIFCMETTGQNRAVCFPISQGYLDAGKEEFKELICRIAYHETYGYDTAFPETYE